MRKSVYVYFDGGLVGSFLDFVDAVGRVKFYLDSILNPEIFNPITIVIK